MCGYNRSANGLPELTEPCAVFYIEMLRYPVIVIFIQIFIPQTVVHDKTPALKNVHVLCRVGKSKSGCTLKKSLKNKDERMRKNYRLGRLYFYGTTPSGGH